MSFGAISMLNMNSNVDYESKTAHNRYIGTEAPKNGMLTALVTSDQFADDWKSGYAGLDINSTHHGQKVVEPAIEKKLSRLNKEYCCWKWRKFIEFLKNNKKSIYLFMFLVVISTLSFGVSVVVRVFQYNTHESIRPEPDYSQYGNVIDITLLGDSLINVPCSEYNLMNKIRQRLHFANADNTTVRFYNEGVNGNTIAMIAARLPEVLSLNASALLLYWDSDMDDLSEEFLNSTEVQSIVTQYENNLRYVLSTSIAYGTDVITVAGPGIYAEGPFYKPLSKRQKNAELDQFRGINKEICEEYDIPYTNLRQRFINAIPRLWVFDRWFVTLDGEHPNGHGSSIIAHHFARRINDWLQINGY